MPNRNGNVASAASASQTFNANMIVMTATTLKISGIRLVMLLVNRSLSVLTSPMILASNLPTGRSSKKENGSFCI